MKKLLFLLVFIFSGCSLKTAFTYDPLYEKALILTQRGQIINSLENKALIDAVYLNELYNNKFKNVTFLIGVYNDFNNELTNKEFTLTLNNQKPTKISKKIPSFILYKNFPFHNEWMSYYIVEFNKTKKPYILKYKSSNWGEVKFEF